MTDPALQEELARLGPALAAGALVLTPNYSSSVQLQNNWCRYALAGKTTAIIETPAIAAIDIWLGKLWQELALNLDVPVLGRRILEPTQELLLWRRVIRSTEAGALLMNIDGTAESAREAMRLLQQWQVSLADLGGHVMHKGYASAASDDREIFLQWATNFSGLCRDEKLLTFSDTVNSLLELANSHPENFSAILPKQILLWGFTDPPPLYRSLFDKFAALAIDVKAWHQTNALPVSRIVACRHEDEECRAVVEWAALTLKLNPAATIGIVCADQRSAAPRLNRMLAQAFGTSAPNLLYSCPLNENLAVQPFIATALQIIELDQDRCDTLQLCQLLRSPSLRGAAEEADARAALELQLRTRGELMTSMATFRELCLQAGKPWHCPVLGTALLSLVRAKKPSQTKQPPSSWLQNWQQQWDALLDVERLLAAGNNNVANAWRKLQADMQKIGFLFPSGAAAEARALFRRLAQETPLAIANTSARIQVTGPVASAGMRFTHVWCMQMTEQHWPGEPQNNPWLPLSLQREAGFPGVDPGTVLHKARQTLQQLIASTESEFVFSHALQAEEAPVRASALLPSGLASHTSELDNPAMHPAAWLFAYEQEQLLDIAALPLSPQLQHSGGGAVLADQAACPFRSFAKHRLKVRELPEIKYGLPANIVGECIHSAMQNFWKVIQNSARLHVLANTDLAEHISVAVTSAMLAISRRYPHTMTPRYQELEQDRLCSLLMDWMQAERLRGSFSVLASEEKLAWQFANLTLNLRIDRIDRNEDGSLTIVDYKTGQKTTTRWQDERPEQPQLLLYQDALDAQNRRGTATALLYAYVNLKDQSYDGVGATDQALPNIVFSSNKTVSAPSWDMLKQHWQTSLQQLAQEYLDGCLVVEPLSRTTCDYCHLHSFCRIGERRQFA